MFHFVDKCSLYNYTDDNSISTASPCVHDVVSNLKTDCNNIMEWFSVNGLQANPSKFQFMLLSSSNIDNSNISLCIDDITLKPEPHVKILCVFLDDKLSFSQHVSISCTKAARQLNALARISRYLNISSRSLLYNSFVRSNFNYCAMVWHFCGKTNNNKIERIQEWALRMIYRDYESSYEDLLSVAEAPTMLTRRLRVILLEVFKSINMLNSDCLNDMFKIKDGNYSFRNTRKLLQPKKKTTTFGLRSIAYLGAKLWNDNVCNFSDAREIDFSTLKTSIDDPSVLLVDGSDFPYLWYFHQKFLAKYVSLMFIIVMLFLST